MPEDQFHELACADLAAGFDTSTGHEKGRIMVPFLASWARAHRVSTLLDLGCGTFAVGAGLAREGFDVAGHNPPAPAMRALAESTVSNLRMQGHRASLLPWVGEAPEAGQWDGVISTFVLPALASRADLLRHLGAISRTAARAAVVIASHPAHVADPHSAYAMNIPSGHQKEDGERMSGTLYADDGAPVFALTHDVWWSSRTVLDLAAQAGLRQPRMIAIDDNPSAARSASASPAYLAWTFLQS